MRKCHCGSVVAADDPESTVINSNMVDYFCEECILVRCDAFPGACNGTYKGWE